MGEGLRKWWNSWFLCVCEKIVELVVEITKETDVLGERGGQRERRQ